jgi:endonuclease-8
MPEIVEVKKYCDFIRKYMKNKEITGVKILKGRYKKHTKFEGYDIIKKSLPLKILSVESKGKFIYIVFDNDVILFCTLGLSGGWVYVYNQVYNQVYNPTNHPKQFIFPNMVEFLNVKDIENYNDRSLNHLNIEFTTSKGSLYFFDTLSFGTIKVVNNVIELDRKLAKIAPDIMDMNTTLVLFIDRIKKYPKKKIGLVLMDQKVISGIGNYLRADVLWMSKISPFRLVGKITEDEMNVIYKSARLLTWGQYNYKKAIKLKIIRKSARLPNYYKRDFFVYYETNDIYGNIVKKEPLYEGSAKRFIYWCPGYQL